jgi:hypothetical protein
MALTDTKKAKDFMAGAPDITLKGDLRPVKMASMDENERELMRLVEEFMEQGFSQQEAIDAAKDELERKSIDYMAEGGIMQTVPRQGYFLGKIVKGIKSAVKGVTKTVKKNPLLALAALNFAPMLAGGSPFIGMGKGRFAGSLFNLPSISSALNLSGDKTGTGAAMDALKIGGVGGAITGLLSGMEQQEGETNQEFGARKARVRDQLNVQFKRLYPQEANESDSDYNIRINAMVEAADDQTIPVGEMAEGGRVSRAFGSDKLVEKASGIEGLPINVNSKGVKELDLRETGGFIPPVGVKEKADDIPAMLSNNEFVFTADAVRAAGGGSVNKGAQRMYDLMKNLESKVV